jgi:hypothetical protein
MYYFSYNYICFYIYVLDRIQIKVSFSQSFLFISRTCLALIILWNEHICQNYIAFKHRSTYAVFQLARKTSERINRVSRLLTVLWTTYHIIYILYSRLCSMIVYTVNMPKLWYEYFSWYCKRGTAPSSLTGEPPLSKCEWLRIIAGARIREMVELMVQYIRRRSCVHWLGLYCTQHRLVDTSRTIWTHPCYQVENLGLALLCASRLLSETQSTCLKPGSQ